MSLVVTCETIGQNAETSFTQIIRSESIGSGDTRQTKGSIVACLTASR